PRCAELQSQSKYNMLFGLSERMVEVQDLIERVADTDVTVLIRGESGTGKELVARALYASSLRRDKPFVKVNCAALPTELLESELFGFERGAFTGAIQHKPGKFEFANHGTMFLDEIGEMSVPQEAKHMRARARDQARGRPRPRDAEQERNLARHRHGQPSRGHGRRRPPGARRRSRPCGGRHRWAESAASPESAAPNPQSEYCNSSGGD